MDINHILSKWNLKDIVILEQYHSDTIRKIYKIYADDKHYLLKGLPDTVSENEIYSNVSAHYFLGNERKMAPKIFATIDGFNYIHIENYWFYLMEYIEGRNMVETVEDEFILGKLARRLHLIKGYNIKSPMSQSTKRFYNWFNERSFKQEFDHILNTLPDFDKNEQCFIHSDLGPHNAMITDHGEAVFIDLDCAGLGSRFMDLGWAFIMQYVDFNYTTGEMHYRFDLAESFLKGYYEKELIKRNEYDLIWQGAIYMHIAYMKCYGPDAIESLWNILKYGIEQKETLWNKLVKLGITENNHCNC